MPRKNIEGQIGFPGIEEEETKEQIEKRKIGAKRRSELIGTRIFPFGEVNEGGAQALQDGYIVTTEVRRWGGKLLDSVEDQLTRVTGKERGPMPPDESSWPNVIPETRKFNLDRIVDERRRSLIKKYVEEGDIERAGDLKRKRREGRAKQEKRRS
ncbi:MAG: hypothetical protein COT89_02250 [Candidatus Colwellbacteria bacterium CG10_big_fil_rev_8_21_14_0_10_42_22]|uniref:Uncharacterized protein n=1 Tax=Candidatus Colwellbacteria bacterium CG10_big_fil_rev_8_21_14_0_10_42_22 TaxID=1974540 RepID=A0A2H0VHT9_9BACT|nr:MAG: hypothetical protein COT89_02250 [Candidatus Colwellbacteria bacterium CG10_big_fil_rev_8_21_14_0_10_42_22]